MSRMGSVITAQWVNTVRNQSRTMYLNVILCLLWQIRFKKNKYFSQEAIVFCNMSPERVNPSLMLIPEKSFVTLEGQWNEWSDAQQLGKC